MDEAWMFNGQDRCDWPAWLKGHPTVAAMRLWPEDVSLGHVRYSIPIIRDKADGRTFIPGDTIGLDAGGNLRLIDSGP